jgi:hypothetical protein
MAAPASSAFGKPTNPPQKERRRNRKKEKQGPSSSCLLLKKKTQFSRTTLPASLSILHIWGNHALLGVHSLGSVKYE